MTKLIATGSGGMQPTTPTIGTATDGGTGTTVSVAFTPSTYIGKGTITYTATSSPGGFTGTSATSPVTVSGLTSGTAYTFTVTGTTNYGVSSATSAASNSVTPAAPGAYDSIASATGNGTSNVIQFTSIPQTYENLQIRASWITTNSAVQNVWFTINGDTGTSYNTSYIAADGAGGSAVSASYAESTNYLLGGMGGTSLSGVTGVSIVDFADYNKTDKRKGINTFHGIVPWSAGSQNSKIQTGSWENNNAITSISFTLGGGNFATGTVVSLYGLKGA